MYIRGTKGNANRKEMKRENKEGKKEGEKGKEENRSEERLSLFFPCAQRLCIRMSDRRSRGRKDGTGQDRRGRRDQESRGGKDSIVISVGTASESFFSLVFLSK